MNHQIINSKYKKMKPLMDDPFLCRHVPETHWFSEERLKRMLETWNTVYIKPDRGRHGLDISRIRRINRGLCELSYDSTHEQLSYQDAVRKLIEKLDPDKRYLVQEGIDLSTMSGSPFHIRVVVQKLINRWQVSLISSLVASTANAVVTNFSRGNFDVHLKEVLHNNDHQWDPFTAHRELIDVSQQIAQVLGEHFPLMIIGLDMAIDKKGKIWFIEANTRPNCTELEKVNDAVSYRKYLEAKKWAEKQPE